MGSQGSVGIRNSTPLAGLQVRVTDERVEVGPGEPCVHVNVHTAESSVAIQMRVLC